MTYITTEEQREKMRAHYRAHKDEYIARAKRWKKNNKEKVNEGQAMYRITAAEKIADYNHRTKEQAAVRAKKLYEKNKEKRLDYAKHRYAEKKELINKQNKQWKLDNKEKVRADNYKYNKKRMQTDIVYKLKQRLSGRMRLALKVGVVKSARTMELIGCTGQFLRGWLESKFTEGMSWENYGAWHIDHIRPLARFDLMQEAQQREAFHYTNLQPLWALDNRMKGARLDWETVQ